jgi:mycofactocin precursor
MNQNPTTESATTDVDELVTEDLIEEVSIDGMCGCRAGDVPPAHPHGRISRSTATNATEMTGRTSAASHL